MATLVQDMSEEDKMLARFAKERAKHHEKASLFNLGDDDEEGEQLTHLGQVPKDRLRPCNGLWQSVIGLWLALFCLLSMVALSPLCRRLESLQC